MSEKKITFEYVTTYIIGKKSNLSVGAPYCRNSPNITIYCKDEVHEERIASLTRDEILLKENILLINSLDDFNNLYDKIKNYIRAQTLGTVGNDDLKKNLLQLKDNIIKKKIINKQDLEEFTLKWDGLYNMTIGSIRNSFDITVAS